jgi:hypothetical protein
MEKVYAMLSTIDNLREVARRCWEGEPLSEDLAAWLANSLEAFLEHRCTSVDDALGLRFPQGGVPWWQEEAIRIRNAALRDLSVQAFSELSLSAQAREVRTISVRYAATGWRRDRELEEMPESYAGTVKIYLWRAYKSGAAMPISERQLRNILGD